jgi:hypothetical protein
MSEGRLRSAPSQSKGLRREATLEPEAVSAMLRLKELGFGTRRIARALGVSRNTVKSYIERGSWRAYKRPARRKLLDGLEHARLDAEVEETKRTAAKTRQINQLLRRDPKAALQLLGLPKKD